MLWQCNEYVMYTVFVLYLLFFLIEKVYLHFKKNRDKKTDAFSALRLALFLVFGLLLLIYSYQILSSHSSKPIYESNAPAVLLLVLYGFQQFADNSVKNAAGTWWNTMFQYSMNNGFAIAILSACVVMYATETKTTMDWVSAAFTVAVAAGIYLDTVVSMKHVDEINIKYYDAMYQFPGWTMMLAATLFLTFFLHKTQVPAHLQAVFLSKSGACIIAAAPVVLVWFMGNNIGIFGRRGDELMWRKLENLQNLVSTDTSIPQYLPLIQQVLTQATRNVFQIKPGSNSSQNIMSQLQIPDSSPLLAAHGLPLSQLSLSDIIETSVQVSTGNVDFSLNAFLHDRQASDNPVNSTKSTSVLKSGSLIRIVISAIALLIVTCLMIRRCYIDEKFPAMAFIMCASAICLIGWSSSVMGQTYSSSSVQYLIKEKYIKESDDSVATATALEYQSVVSSIVASSGQVTFAGKPLFADANRLSMTELYAQLTAGETKESIVDLINQYKVAFTDAIKLASIARLADYDSAATVLSSGPLNGITLETMLRWLADKDGFAECVGLPFWRPEPSTDQEPVKAEYVSVVKQSSGALNLTFTALGAQLQQCFETIKKVMNRIAPMIAHSSDNFSAKGQMNIKLIADLYSDTCFQAVDSKKAFAVFDSSKYLDICVKIIQSFFDGNNVDSAVIWADISAPNKEWNAIKSSLHDNLSLSVVYNKLKDDDKTIVEDIFRHCVDLVSAYDSALNEYLNIICWVAKINLVARCSSVYQDILYVEKKVFPIMIGSTYGAAIALAVGLSIYMDVGVKPAGKLFENFLSTLCGLKPSISHNSLVVTSVILFIAGTSTYMMNLFDLENCTIRNVLTEVHTEFVDSVGSASVQKRVTLMPLALAISLSLAIAPAFWKTNLRRRQVILSCLLILGAFCTPLSYAVTKNETIAQDNKIVRTCRQGTFPILAALCVSILCMVKFSDNRVVQDWRFRLLFFLGCILFSFLLVSLPTVFLSFSHPDMQSSEFVERVNSINTAVYISTALLLAMTVLYLLVLQRHDLFSNKIQSSKANIYTSDLIL